MKNVYVSSPKFCHTANFWPAVEQKVKIIFCLPLLTIKNRTCNSCKNRFPWLLHQPLCNYCIPTHFHQDPGPVGIKNSRKTLSENSFVLPVFCVLKLCCRSLKCIHSYKFPEIVTSVHSGYIVIIHKVTRSRSFSNR